MFIAIFLCCLFVWNGFWCQFQSFRQFYQCTHLPIVYPSPLPNKTLPHIRCLYWNLDFRKRKTRNLWCRKIKESSLVVCEQLCLSDHQIIWLLEKFSREWLFLNSSNHKKKLHTIANNGLRIKKLKEDFIDDIFSLSIKHIGPDTPI